ncbi:hypothetical protein L6255_00275 [Candidatus Parcubacteria bacterium]|nr:hypothetical protein [Patescibacteria group bacterium]MCG2688876.1 hypothetical protein [Candidatus Parcubacteria bacterium]
MINIKYKLTSNLVKRECREKIFLFNPETDNILELNKYSWEIVNRLCENSLEDALIKKSDTTKFIKELLLWKIIY